MSGKVAGSIRLLHIATIPMSFTFLKGQAAFMRERGLEVTAISSPGPELDAFAHAEGVRAYAVEMARSVTPIRDLKAVARIRRVMRDVRPHIVHAHTPKGGLLGMISAALESIPVRIYHLRGLPLMGASGWKRALLRQTEVVSCALAHRVLCVSGSLRDSALAEGLCPVQKIVIPAGGSGQGVDLGRFDPERTRSVGAREVTRARFGIPTDAFVVGFVGRLVREKGIAELEAAWRALRERAPTAHLLLVGPREAHDPVPPEVMHRLESDARVHLVGEDWNSPPLFAAMDLVVLPSYREGFPNVPLEAAAMRLPVVATRIPGCIDAVQDGLTGTLVAARDPTPLAQAMLSYVLQPGLGQDHGTAGRARVEREFRREVVWEAIYHEYRNLIGSRLPQDQ